jgi:hypothetical protein
MSWTLLSETRPIARKSHRCIWCGQGIAPGEQYLNVRGVYEGDMQNQHWHPECAQAQQQEGRETDDWEFESHSNERPPQAQQSLVACHPLAK